MKTNNYYVHILLVNQKQSYDLADPSYIYSIGTRITVGCRYVKVQVIKS